MLKNGGKGGSRELVCEGVGSGGATLENQKEGNGKFGNHPPILEGIYN